MEETHWVTNHFMPILHNLAYGNLGQLALWALGLAQRDHPSLQSKNFFIIVLVILLPVLWSRYQEPK
jgi:hypothetical protein